jgi:hypothetical protein
MNKQIILRATKIIIFILVLSAYRFASFILAEILFAIGFAMYLIEIYKGGKPNERKRKIS